MKGKEDIALNCKTIEAIIDALTRRHNAVMERREEVVLHLITISDHICLFSTVDVETD